MHLALAQLRCLGGSEERREGSGLSPARGDRLEADGRVGAAAAKRIVRALVPPVVLEGARRARAMLARGLPDWEYVPEGWPALRADPLIKGWNVEAIRALYEEKVPAFLEALEGTEPLAIATSTAYPTRRGDIRDHNAILSYAYVLALAGANREHLSILDWGGGVGLYFHLSKSLLPGVAIEYHCREVPLVVACGRQLIPEVRFYDDDSCLGRHYDLVLASRSLQYFERWGEILEGMGRSTDRWLYVVVPVCFNAPSFVLRHRAYSFGFETEFLTWVFNRDELVERAERGGVELVRELVHGYERKLPGAPEADQHLGFLFRPR